MDYDCEAFTMCISIMISIKTEITIAKKMMLQVSEGGRVIYKHGNVLSVQGCYQTNISVTGL